jgi:prepilin-type N-terminal cleavage/methylation domain-containing protein
MEKLAGPNPHPTGSGFTLIELLLSVVLLLLLAGAAVISFSTLLRGSQLEEGANQMENLVRYARAYAANSGKKVQLTFDELTEEGALVPLGNVEVYWESDPTTRPGVFAGLPDAAVMARNVLDLVQIEDVRSLGDPDSGRTNRENPDEESAPSSFAPITFYPDGSSDSAEIVLSSRDSDEVRRVALRISGITGAIRREWLSERQTEMDESEKEPSKAMDRMPAE